MEEVASIVLGTSGHRARIVPDRLTPGGYELVVDGIPQSHVDLDDPTRLYYEYVARMGHVIDLLAEPGAPVTAVHLGAGALTLPRYIEATRPGSRQQVIELERELVDLVRVVLPLPRRASIRVRYADARAGLAKLPPALIGRVDLLVVDVFSGATIPTHITSVEFYRRACALLAPHGVILVNTADGPPLRFARGQAATLAAAIQHVAALAETQVLKGRRFGNVVLVGSATPLPLDWLPHLLASGPFPAKAVADAEFADFIAGSAVVTDDTATAPPAPRRGVFDAPDRPSPY